jgi:hypothetical protein
MSRAIDREQIGQYAKALFRHADPDGYVLLRAFRGDSTQSWRPLAWSGIRVGEDLAGLIDAAARLAEAAAESGENIAFCPPVATFRDAGGAGKKTARCSRGARSVARLGGM